MLNYILLQAAPAAQAQGGSQWGFWMMMIAILVVFYLFMILPQRRKQKELDRQRNAMKAGDKVVTAGGIHGYIKKVEEQTLLIEVDKNVCIRVDKASVYTVAEEKKEEKVVAEKKAEKAVETKEEKKPDNEVKQQKDKTKKEPWDFDPENK